MHFTIYYTKSNLNNYVHVDNIIFNLQLIHLCLINLCEFLGCYWFSRKIQIFEQEISNYDDEMSNGI